MTNNLLTSTQAASAKLRVGSLIGEEVAASSQTQKEKTMNLVKIQFAGDNFLTFKDEENIVWVALRPVVDFLGMDWGTQQKKIAEYNRFNCRLMPTVGGDKKLREMWCIPVKKLRHWLFSISPHKVREAVQEKLIKYQDELCDIIDDYYERRSRQQLLFPEPAAEDLRPKTILLRRAFEYYADRRRGPLMTESAFWTECKKRMGATRDETGKYVVEVDRFEVWLRNLSLRLN